MSTEQAQPSEDRATLPDALRRQDNEAIMLLRQKWKRLNVRNEHWMCCIVGEEGMGKSWTGIKIGSMIDPNFGADNVFFHPAEALERLRDGDFSAGDVWVLDEAGVGLGNRTWHDSGQVKLNQALQLIRSHNIGFIFTLPTLNELDKQAKNRLQNVYEVREKRDGSFIRGRWFTSEVDRMGFNSRRRDVWWDYEVVNGKEVQSVAFTPPPQEIVEPYEEKKEAFQREFYDETIAELRGEDAPETDEQQTIPELAAEIAEQGIADYLGWHGGHNKPKLSREALAEKHNLSIRKSKRVKELLLQEHAVDVEKAWEENRA
jgi:hypothetical protein